jgi:hypothetical protein
MKEVMGIDDETTRRHIPDDCVICEAQRRLNIIYWLLADHAQPLSNCIVQVAEEKSRIAVIW